MKTFFIVFVCSLIIGLTIGLIMPVGSSSFKTKTRPEHIGVAKEVVGFKVMYDLEAALHSIYFKNPITIGFNSIKIKNKKRSVVGLCTYGKNFREIDIDTEFWNKSTWETKRSLIYHEMTHCFCHRLHTFKDGVYPEAEFIDKNKANYMEQPGYLFDGCPMSIMYPYVLTDDCVNKHWNMYDNEMFDDCDPY